MTRDDLDEFYRNIEECRKVTMRDTAIKMIKTEISSEFVKNGESRYWRDLNITYNEYGQNLGKHNELISEILRDINGQKARLGGRGVK